MAHKAVQSYNPLGILGLFIVGFILIVRKLVLEDHVASLEDAAGSKGERSQVSANELAYIMQASRSKRKPNTLAAKYL